MPGERLTLAALPQLQHLFGPGLDSIRRTERFVQLCEQVGGQKDMHIYNIHHYYYHYYFYHYYYWGMVQGCERVTD